MMTMHRLVLCGLLGASLVASGCDKKEADKKETAANKKDAAKKDGADGKDGAGPGDVADEPAGDGAEDAPDVLDERVLKAASLAKKIDADPTKTDEILAAAGMDRAAFEALIYEVSSPELAEQYRLAMARDET